MRCKNITKKYKKFYFIALLLVFITTGFATNSSKTGQSKSLICSACHGAQGISPMPIWPNLAGQHARYLRQQLQEFKSGQHRHAPAMSPMAIALSEQDMADLATFYAQQPLAKPKPYQPSTRLGEHLYRQGDSNKHIPACITCHGPNGLGNEEAGFPVISHQQVEYIVQQLQAFKSGTRSTDPMGIMRTISGKLSSEEMRDLADYLASLP